MQLTDVFPVAVRRTKIVANDPYSAGPLKKTLSILKKRKLKILKTFSFYGE